MTMPSVRRAEGESRDARMVAAMKAERDFSDELEEWLRSDAPKTIGALEKVFEEKTFAVAILLLMFVPALPAPTGGVTHVFEVITILIAGQMVIGRRALWIPNRWRNRELGALATGKALPFVIRRIRWFEKFSRPRMSYLFDNAMFLRLLGVVIIAFTLGAFVAPPFSGLDTLPALGVVIIALSIILEDVVVLGIGVFIGLGGIVLIVTIGSALAHFLRNLF
jgi:hypothetical protein